MTAAGTRLIVWRHGQTEWNGAGRVQGQTDIPLDDTGRRQAVEAATLLTLVRPTAIVSSDLSRAADTAAALGEVTGLPIRADARLRERFYGAFQGLDGAQIAERYPVEHARWRAGEHAPGCDIESQDDLGKRVGEALRDAADAHPGQVVVVATHGGAARQGTASLLGWAPEVMRSVGTLANCHWIDLRHDPHRGWQLRAYNVGPANPRHGAVEPSPPR